MSKKIRKIKIGGIDITFGKKNVPFAIKSKIQKTDSKSWLGDLKKEFEKGGKIFPENREINELQYCFN
tara:strand:+ start:991 stop:1194 length:204 start_codon:yes stop_codon:yes gene_type:complete